MKSILPLSLVLAFAASPALAADAAPAAAAAPAKDPIAWETTFATASKKAETDKKPMLLKFYTGWCPFCTKMDKTTWVDPGVAKAASSFSCGKINADVEAPAVARYRTTGYPTVIVADATGEAVVKMEGYKDPATVTKVLTSYLEQKDDLATALATLKTDKKNVDAQLVIADFHAGAGLNDSAADAYRKLLKGAEGAQFVRASAGAGLTLTRAGKAQDAQKLLAKGLEAAGPAPSPALLLALSENEKALGNADKANSYRDRLVTEHPASPEAAQVKASM